MTQELYAEMCWPCRFKIPDGSCILAEVSRAEQELRAKAGLCEDAESGLGCDPRVLVMGKWYSKSEFLKKRQGLPGNLIL